jgi:ferredoxin
MIKESTRRIFRMHGWRVDRAIHNYLYFTQYDRYVALFLQAGRWTVKLLGWLPLVGPAFRVVFNRYHAKVLTGSDATKILTLQKSIKLGPDTTERVIPFPYANQIILEEPDYIVVMDCPCRSAREKPCLPLHVCLAVGRTTASFWLEHGQKYHARKLSQAEALEIVRSERRKGRITTAWFKVATGGRTGVICSCCSCCCGGLEAMRLARQVKGGEHLTNLIPSGYLVAYRPELCRDCGTCARTCMFGAIEMDAEGKPGYDSKRCYGCGLCVEQCPHQARTLTGEFREIYPLDLDLVQEKLGINRRT